MSQVLDFSFERKLFWRLWHRDIITFLWLWLSFPGSMAMLVYIRRAMPPCPGFFLLWGWCRFLPGLAEKIFSWAIMREETFFLQIWKIHYWLNISGQESLLLSSKLKPSKPWIFFPRIFQRQIGQAVWFPSCFFLRENEWCLSWADTELCASW